MPSGNQTANKPTHITKGDVFDDLGLSRAEAAEAKVKAELWRDLVTHIRPLELTQKELARRLGVHQPEVSNLLNGKLSKFSAGTLIQFATALDLDVRVTVMAPKKRKGTLKTVHARGKEHRQSMAALAST